MILIRRISGKSMLPTLMPFQIVVFKRTSKFQVGQIVLANIDRLEVIKRIVSVNSKGVYLQGDAPDSTAYFAGIKDLKAVLVFKLSK